ncbi:MAG: stage III sporulation protein AF [Clostridium sp.]
MGAIETFVITLVTTLIFMTAIELIVPDNSFKKYIKFVLGLILIAVLINPIVRFLTEGEKNLTSMIDQFSNSTTAITKNDEGEKKRNEIQEKAFKESFNKNVVLMLNNEFPKTEFQVDIDSKIDLKATSLEINKVRVTMDDKSIKKVEKVQIGEGKSQKEELTSKEKKVQEYISEELGIGKEKVIINNKG